MTGALDGVRILDCSSGVAGPLGVLLLAEHGADVIKVEAPGGDPMRAYEGYRCWNRSRRSVTLDLKSDSGRRSLADLVATADVVVESNPPDRRARLGLDYETISAENLGVVLVSCPAYPDGHRLARRQGHDALVQATSGQMWEQPGWRTGPVFLHMPMPSMGALYLVACGALAALSARRRTGVGQHVRTSLYQGALLFTTQIWQDVERATLAYHQLMAKSYPPGVHQQMIFECAGRTFVHVSVMSGLAPTKSLDEVIGLGGASDALSAATLSAAERRDLDRRRLEALRQWRPHELVEELRRHDHAAEVIGPAESMFAHPQTIANQTVALVVDPDVGQTTQVGVPLHLLGTPGSVRGPQPRPGQHNEEILAEVPTRAAAARRPRPPDRVRAGPSGGGSGDGPGRGLALEGVRVIDLGQYLAGPFGPMVLADLGADVVKVEPVTGDKMRSSAKAFIGCQRGKRSVALDLKSHDGLAAAKRLVSGADVVHHNMTRGVATRLGIDYAVCRELRPDIIYCNTYAYGLPDPLGRFGGLDPLFQASSGLEHEAGGVDAGGAPLYLRFGMCDTSNAMLSAVGVLLALVHRQRTGAGQELWTSLHDGGLIFSSDVWLDRDGRPWSRPHLDAGLHGLSALYRLYRTQDEDWICIAATDDASWERLCKALGAARLADDPRFCDAAGRKRHREDLESQLEELFARRTARYWTLALDEAGVANEIPFDALDGIRVMHDADNVGLGLVAEYDHPLLGKISQFGELVSFSETPGRIWGPPPLVGQHTRVVLRQAGYRDGDVDSLVSSGAAYEPDETYAERFAN
jgi:crotonobetainyl-CoA:carnitine CoA-transferase CaiB-like acyl-CoA transferase